MAFYRSALRDDILPNEEWRELWAKLDAHLEPRSASKLIVTALRLASLEGQAESVIDYLRDRVEAGMFPSPRDLQQHFDTRTAMTPQIETKQHPLCSYDSLIANQQPTIGNSIFELRRHHG
jgi:hypothetical protein